MPHDTILPFELLNRASQAIKIAITIILCSYLSRVLLIAPFHLVQHEMTFDSADAGASLTYPMQCSALRKNGFVVIKNRPCKIVDMSTSKTGKHGHAKVHLVATDIFTGKKYEDLSPSTHNMDVPNVSRREYQLLDISDDGFLSLMTDDGDTKDDVPLPDNEVGQKITKLFKEEEKDTNVIVLTSMGEECAMEAKEAPNQG
ncbi:eukaryotic translation initiation factor 5A [Fusarium verticillioides 7600]|uniref:Eukaryotic translation initiation factor 5A n=11 Tax=Fusarium TaxID=5506 RepID=W7MHN2_GIBM7|nr:eukaryotic translation initiation factor 5A [Fusarium verticillioides 7600]EWG47050.1 eukaryotic translation initiation factor 5A [Fusarium verticillioides 7600]